ncbi:MAG: hypothetical protein ACI8TX_000945 [Hyphomicrobiaceae bacterium]|jgi:hypothetical protein
MRIRLRQVALVARDLGAVERAIGETFGLSLCYRDPGVATFGLTNALFAVGDKLLEVVSPNIDGTTAGRLLDKRGGDCGYMVIVQVDDLDEMRIRFANETVRIVFEAKVRGVTGLHVHPRDVGGAILSVDQTDDWDEWPWAGPDWKQLSAGPLTDIRAVEIQAQDPAGMADRWARVLGRTAVANSITLDEGEIRFLPVVAVPSAIEERGEGVVGIEFASRNGLERSVTLGGCEMRIVPDSRAVKA